jgi:hypothetical protein
MKYIVKSALDAGTQQLTTVQRTHPYFSEAPVVAGHTLRRGSVVQLSEDQYLLSKVTIERLIKAQAIKVEKLEDPPPETDQTVEQGSEIETKPSPVVVIQASERPLAESAPDSSSGDSSREAEHLPQEASQDPGGTQPSATAPELSVPTPTRKRKGRQS